MSYNDRTEHFALLAWALALVASTYNLAAGFFQTRMEVMRQRRSHGLADANRAQMDDLPGVIIMVGIAIVAGFAVLFLANEVIQIMNLSEGDPLYSAYESLVSATDSVFGMFGFLFVLVIIAVGLAYLMRLR